MPAIIGKSTLTTGLFCDGQSHTIKTTRDPGESNADFVARHLQAVADKRASCSGTATIGESTWSTDVSCNGTTTPVLNTKLPAESWEDFTTRHQAAVDAEAAGCA